MDIKACSFCYLALLLLSRGLLLVGSTAALTAVRSWNTSTVAPVRNQRLGSRMKIITGGHSDAVNGAQSAILNQNMFSSLHGYRHEVHAENLAYPWTAYWHKIYALLRELQSPDSPDAPEVLVWMDLDVVVTNPLQHMLDDILAANPHSKLILTEDPQRGEGIPVAGRAKRLVNTGIIIVRRSAEAQQVLEKLFTYGRRHHDAAYQPQSMNTLHEQDAFNWLLGGPLGRLLGRQVAVIPQRQGPLNLNTFPRNFYDESYKDPVATEWMEGDFTAHCSGLRPQQREWCIRDSCEAAASAVEQRSGASAAPPKGLFRFFLVTRYTVRS